ncbi:MAG: hypothetical protein IKF99_17595 [Oscillospiraceae bacterium]|nr:hypothetical protein [Oscillospiraceae bacterium]
MADLGKAYVQIVPSAKGISGSIQKELNGASGAGDSAGQNLGSKLLGGFKKVFAVAAVGKVLNDALSAGGDLQQSFGGLETIYGDAASGAKEYAVQAAAAGISANSYAEQAVSFGAALKQAYGGDTVAAMEAANTAIMDMADNSAKMGTDISSVQAAYQGFAKQNYTMLDNLKLGYGGTKTEMERLLADAEKLTGVKYDINNLGDVYNAIHAVQGELGLTGVAADEAKTTLTGSVAAMKASWTNLLAAMTTGNGLQAAMTNFGTSVGNVLTNVVGMLTNVVTQLPALLTGLMTTLGPSLIPAATALIQGLLTSITSAAGSLLTAGPMIILQLVTGITQALPGLLAIGSTAIQNLASTISASFPTLLATGIQIIMTLLTGLTQALPQILSGGLSAAMQFLTGVLQNLPQILEAGISLLGELAAGAISAIPTLIGMIPDLFSQFLTAFSSVDWNSLGKEIIDGIIRGLDSGVTALWEALKGLARDALQAAKNALQIGSPSKLFADQVGKWIPAGVSVGIEDETPQLTKTINGMVDVAGYDYARAANAGPAVSSPQTAGIDYNRLAAALAARPDNRVAKLFVNGKEFARAVFEDQQAVSNDHGGSLIRV